MRYSNNWPSCTYDLETDEGEGIGWSDERFQTIAQVNVLSGEDGSDDQIRGILTIDQVHVHPGDTRRKWLDDQVRGIQTIDQFPVLSGDEWRGRGRSDETVFKLTKFTYELKTHEEDDHIRGFQTIDKVHVRSGDGWRGRGIVIRWEVLLLTKFTGTYILKRKE